MYSHPIIIRAEQHRQDLLQSAEQIRQTRQVRIAKRHSSIHRFGLAAIGRRLNQWSAQLQTGQPRIEKAEPITVH